MRAEALKINKDFTDRITLYTQNPGNVEALRKLIAAAENLEQFSCAYVSGAGAASIRAALDGFKRQLVELEAGGERAAAAEETARQWVEEQEHDSRSLSWGQTLGVLALGCAIVVICIAISGAFSASSGKKPAFNPPPAAAAAKMPETERKQTEEFWKQSREKEKAEEEKRKEGLDKAAREARGYPNP